MTIFVLDPGHGGIDPGAAGSGLQEKELNLDIAVRIRKALIPYQVEVYLTRCADIAVGLYERAAFANRIAADYFLSIHVNAGGGTGFESYVHPLADETTLRLQDLIHGGMRDFYRCEGFADRGKKTANFAVLRLTSMPALLLENLFLDTQADALRLADPFFRAGIAAAAAASLALAFGLPSSGAWNPFLEIDKLKAGGLLNSEHEPLDNVFWGELAAVINRYRGRSSASDYWDPGLEVARLVSDGLANTDHDVDAGVTWGEFAMVLNRLRGVRETMPWNPEGEVQKLLADCLINSTHDPITILNWGEFATVINRLVEA